MSNNTQNSKNTKFLYFLIVIISALFFTSLAALLGLIVINNESIYNGIYIEGVDVSGLNAIEAATKIEEQLVESLQDNKLNLRYGDKLWVFSSEEIGLEYDFKRAIDEALRIGRKGSYLDRIAEIIKLIKEPQRINIKSKVDVNLINSILDIINSEIYIPSKEARIERVNGEFVIHEGSVGISLNKQRTFSKIIHELSNSKYYEVVEVDIATDTLSPKLTAETLSNIQHLLGSYTTKFNSRVRGRSHNIYLSSKAINGTVLLPGEIFSFNKVVGPRNSSNGYREAPVIIKGDLVDGLGGGVCQVSSTLYNSALKSELEIIERYNHSIPSTYVPKGLDATVSYGTLDLKFRNSHQYPVYIESYVKGNSLTINVYGYKTNNREIKLYSQVDKVIKMDTEIIYDSSLLVGKEIIKEKGRNGYRVSSYAIIYDNGNKIDSKLIAKDYYGPSKRIIIRGIKKPVLEQEEHNKSTENDEVKND